MKTARPTVLRLTATSHVINPINQPAMVPLKRIVHHGNEISERASNPNADGATIPNREPTIANSPAKIAHPSRLDTYVAP